MNTWRAVAAALPLLAACGVAAQTTIYRCGDGRTFSQTPCGEQRGFVVDGRTDAAARDAARAVAARDAALAERLAQERRAREAEGFATRQAAGFTLAPRTDPRGAADTPRETRRAKSPKVPTTKKPARTPPAGAGD
ncbi:DUF4124 domain-containing protein [Azohydromonas sediminis]|uniref:DUF4124 domain-containing protein n=1 Tax=Azohydromonas sediminis TaxID=2259674 RepID=UPI000E6599BE|nr:DUF4124 domain-containing protein [Azohydromonas sediminis]